MNNNSSLPAPSRQVPALTRARIRTALILNGAELPSCFADATLAATLNAYERGASKQVKRRLSGKVVRLGTVQP